MSLVFTCVHVFYGVALYAVPEVREASLAGRSWVSMSIVVDVGGLMCHLQSLPHVAPASSAVEWAAPQLRTLVQLDLGSAH